MQGDGSDPKSEAPVSKEHLSKKGAEVGECLLSNSMFFAVGLAGGSILSLRKKNLRPFVTYVSLGTVADMVYGYTTNCRQHINDYYAAKATFESSRVSPGSKPA
jgi:hypothetical protein